MGSWYEVGQWVVMIDKTHEAFGKQGYVSSILGKRAIVDFREPGYFGVDCGFDQLEIYNGLKHNTPSAPDDAPDGENSWDAAQPDWCVNPSDRELEAYGDGYEAGLTDGPDYTSLRMQIDTLQAQLAAANERAEAAERALAPFAKAADCSLIKTKGRLAVNGKEFILAVGPDSALFLHTDHLDAAKAALAAQPTAIGSESQEAE